MQRLQSSKIPLSYWEVIGRVLRFLQVWSPMVQFFLPVSFYMMLSIKTVVLICRSSSKSLVQSHAKTVVKTRSLILIVMPWILYLWTVCHLVFLLSLLFFFFFFQKQKRWNKNPKNPKLLSHSLSKIRTMKGDGIYLFRLRNSACHILP